MNNIYQEAIHAVEEGAKFKVDFRQRSLKIDGKHIIDYGQYEGELGVAKSDIDAFISHIEELYKFYKYSVPSERSESKSRQYFKALPEKDLEDDDMLYGKRRDPAQITLELYILCQMLLGFEWDEQQMGKWFWQSKEDGDLILLRQWFEPNN